MVSSHIINLCSIISRKLVSTFWRVSDKWSKAFPFTTSILRESLNSVVAILLTGSGHRLLSLDELLTKLIGNMAKLRSDMLDREDKLSDLFKHVHVIISDFDDKTKDMIDTLHRSRDEQVITSKIVFGYISVIANSRARNSEKLWEIVRNVVCFHIKHILFHLIHH